MVMHIRLNKGARRILLGVAVVAALLLVTVIKQPQPIRAENERIITVYHDGVEQTVVTDAKTVAEALSRARVTLNKNDSVEPAADTVLVSPGYSINVYRARPVTVIDGNQRFTVMTSHTSAREIAQAAGISLYDEDTYAVTRIDDFLAEGGVGLKMTIDRAVPLRLVLYGKEVDVRTQARTVGDLMKEKNIILQAEDGANLAASTPITAGTVLQVWRNGVQTVTNEEPVAFTTKQIRDTDREIGYKAVQEPGVVGKKMVTYQIEMRDGKETSRKVIQSVVTQESKQQVEVVGAKPGNGLTKAKGVNTYVDSKGVAHRETYYDLQMGGVMRYCNGSYSVRGDGAKVDQDGYVLVAANLSRYPRCSIVETSLGLGKVYDTGGFATVHPDGFDLATDWSNNDGR